MKLKKIMLVILMLLTIIAIGTVSASEDVADENVTAIEPTDDAPIQLVEDKMLESDDSEDILADDEFEPTVIYPHEFYHNDFYPNTPDKFSVGEKFNLGIDAPGANGTFRVYYAGTNDFGWFKWNNTELASAKIIDGIGVVELSFDQPGSVLYPVGYYSNDFWIEYNTTKGNGSLLCTGTHIFENHKDINVTVTPNKFVVGESVVTLSFSSPVNGWLEYYVDGYGSIVYDNMYEDDGGATVVELNTSSVKRTIEDLSVGTHEIRVFFERYSDWEWDEYLYGPDPYKFSKIFTVNVTEWIPTYTQLATKITSSKVTTTYNVAKKVTFTLKDENNHVLSGENVTVNFNGKTYNKVTDSKGQVSVDVPSGLAPKTYNAYIKFAGDESFKASSASAKVVVSKATPKITAKAKTFKKSVKTKKYKITLKNNLNKVMKNTKVTIKVNKKTYTAKTNSKGVATFKITKLTKKGTFKATITYKGNTYYNKLTKKVNIKVK